jgi:hypothetical protein
VLPVRRPPAPPPPPVSAPPPPPPPIIKYEATTSAITVNPGPIENPGPIVKGMCGPVCSCKYLVNKKAPEGAFLFPIPENLKQMDTIQNFAYEKLRFCTAISPT